MTVINFVENEISTDHETVRLVLKNFDPDGVNKTRQLENVF